MFDHSIKVPRIYKTAAKLIQRVREGDGSVKQLVYDTKHTNIKALYALTVETLQKNDLLDSLLKRTKLLDKEPRLDPWLTRILIYELLWGKKRLQGESKPVKTILVYEQVLRAHLSDVPSPDKARNSSSKVDKPRYVRVNTLSMSTSEAVDAFRDEGWTLATFLDKNNYKEFLNKVASIEEGHFMVDIHVPELLIFPPKTEFYKHSAYKNGSIVLQDKASCLPVHILNPSPGSVVLDMCAAPGMKTTQLAAHMNNKGTVYAVEMDQRRFNVLTKMVESSGATCVKSINRDVLTFNDSDFPDLEYILVDPSCSGSGMIDRLEYEEREDPMRLGKLAGFQIKILRSALTKFSKVKRVVYSTCSVYPEENEDVVRQVLETNSRFKLVPAQNLVNNTWGNFGSPKFGDIGTFCLYARPRDDLTNGFFVAVFERLQEGENNPFFNMKVFNNKKYGQTKKERDDKRKQKRNQEISHKDNDINDETNQEVQQETTNEEIILQSEIEDCEKIKKQKKKKRSEASAETGFKIEHNEEITEDSNKQQKKREKHVNEASISNNLEEYFEDNGKNSALKRCKKKIAVVTGEECNRISCHNEITSVVGHFKKNKKRKYEKTEDNQNYNLANVDVKSKKKKINKIKDTSLEDSECNFDNSLQCPRDKTKINDELIKLNADGTTGNSNVDVEKIRKKKKHKTKTSFVDLSNTKEEKNVLKIFEDCDEAIMEKINIMVNKKNKKIKEINETGKEVQEKKKKKILDRNFESKRNIVEISCESIIQEISSDVQSIKKKKRKKEKKTENIVESESLV